MFLARNFIVLWSASLTIPVTLLTGNLQQGVSAAHPLIAVLVIVGIGLLVSIWLTRWLGWLRGMLIAAAAIVIWYNWSLLVQLPEESGFAWLPGILLPLIVLAAITQLVGILRSHKIPTTSSPHPTPMATRPGIWEMSGSR